MIAPIAPEGMTIHAAAAVTPDDTTPLPGTVGLGPARFIYVGGVGNVSIISRDGVTLTFTALEIGRWHIMPPFTHVRSTLTTATLLIVGY